MKLSFAIVVALMVVLYGTQISDAFPSSGMQTAKVRMNTYAFEHDVVLEPAPPNMPNFCVLFDERGFWVILNGQKANLACWKEIDAASKAVRGH